MNIRLILALFFALTLAVPLSLLAGRVWIDPLAPQLQTASVILVELRLPRAVLALVLGAGLGTAGAAMQGYLRNPLADPGLFGIAPGAALGAVLSFWTGYAAAPYMLPLFALAGAGGAMGLLALIAGRGGGVALFTLAGLMVSSLAGALMSLAISLSPSPFAMSEIVTWMMGSLADRTWHEVWIALPLTVLGVLVLGMAGRDLDAMTLGETAAHSLGVDPLRLRALLMLLADCLCRILPLSGGELRLGIALSLLGTPFFLRLLLRMRKEMA